MSCSNAWSVNLLCQSVHEACHDCMQPHTTLEFRQCPQQGIQCAQVEGIRETLDNTLHQVLLRQLVLTRHNLAGTADKGSSL